MLFQISPTTVFFIEGCGQLGYAMCWGESMHTMRSLQDPAWSLCCSSGCIRQKYTVMQWIKLGRHLFITLPCMQVMAL